MAKKSGIANTRQGEMLRALFKVLLDHPEGLSGRQALAKMEELVPFTEYEAGFYPSAPHEKRAMIATRFATVNCVKAGWMTKDRGSWEVTQEGEEAYNRYTDPTEFMQQSIRRYGIWKKQQNKAEEIPETVAGQRPASIEVVTETMTVELAEESAWERIQDYLTSMDPYDFQFLVAALLRAMGYYVGWVSPPGPDRGLDIIAYTDPLGATGPRIKVQVRRRQEKTTVDGIRTFLALLASQDVGLYISAGGFTSDAEREVRIQENRRITLIDLKKLFSLWVEHYEKVDDQEKVFLPLKPVHFLAPKDFTAPH
jgi:restriction system protein